MLSSRCKPMEIANCGMPCRKLVVPSSGSTIQVWLSSFARLLAAFLTDEAVAGPRLHQFGAQDVLSAAIRSSDKISRTLQRDLKLLDLAEIAVEAARGLAGGGGHHIDKGGTDHAKSLKIDWFGGAEP